MDAHTWAHEQFFGVKLPDLRLKRRLVEVAARIRAHPCGTLPRAMRGKAALKGAYRLLAHPKATHAGLMEPHLDRTRARCRNAGEYLMIEDTTELSFSQRGGVAGMGPLTGETSQGFLVHTCLAVRVERWGAEGVPEVSVPGVFSQESWARQRPEGSREQRKREKRRRKADGTGTPESDRWGRAFCTVPDPPGDALWTLVADREADIFGLMARCRARGRHFIVRAAQARKTGEGRQDVFEAASRAPLLGSFSLPLRARPGAPARTARLEVRAVEAVIQPPLETPSGHAPQGAGLVEAREVGAPEGASPVHWLLLSSWPCGDLSQALRVVRAYACRWLIEEYHKALKTGTRIEESQLSTLHRIEALLAIHAVVAAELLRLKLLCRTHPDDSAPGDLLPPGALAVLEMRFGLPEGGWTNNTLLRAVAQLGGYLNRNNDGPPGWLSLWRGWLSLSMLAEGYMLGRQQKSCG